MSLTGQMRGSAEVMIAASSSSDARCSAVGRRPVAASADQRNSERNATDQRFDAQPEVAIVADEMMRDARANFFLAHDVTVSS